VDGGELVDGRELVEGREVVDGCELVEDRGLVELLARGRGEVGLGIGRRVSATEEAFHVREALT
jgi:hypothetical protein